MAKPKNLASDEKLTEQLIPLAAKEYDRSKSDRKANKFDDKMLAGDGMFRCFRNSTLADSEKAAATGHAAEEEPTADVASIRFFRLVNQKAGLLSAVVNSTDHPIKFSPIANPEVFHSAQEGIDQAAVHNVLSKYTWKKDNCKEKIYDFAVQLFKYSNVPVQIIWNETPKRMKVRDPQSGKTSWKDVTTNVYPSWKVLSWSQVYADLYAGPISNQRFVTILSAVPWSSIQDDTNAKFFDEDQVQKIRDDRTAYRWDGSEGSDIRKEMAKNEGLPSFNPGESDLYMKWDTFAFLPIENGKWKDEADYTLWWHTGIGNSIDINSMVSVRMVTDFDPDGEIPIYMVNALPDDMDLLYHMMWSEAVRPQYSVECSLWNLAIDGIRGLNNPMLCYDSNFLNEEPEDMRYKPGGTLDIAQPSMSIREFSPASTIRDTAQLISMVQDETQTAANINPNMMGQNFGDRTSATENLAINRWSQQPNMAEVRYVLGGLFTWLGRKYKSYWQGFGPDDLIKAIADESLAHPVYIDKVKDKEMWPSGMSIYGDFDVQLDVIDEFTEDFVAAGQELQFLSQVTTNPQLMNSATHSVDVGFWLRDIGARLKMKKIDRIITPNGGSDGALRQREEFDVMRETQQPISPDPNENHDAHISECDAEILRHSPLLSAKVSDLGEDVQADQNWADFYINQLIKPHRDAHAQMKNQRESQLSAAGPTPPQTPGNEAGAIPQGILGGIAGQGAAAGPTV